MYSCVTGVETYLMRSQNCALICYNSINVKFRNMSDLTMASLLVSVSEILTLNVSTKDSNSLMQLSIRFDESDNSLRSVKFLMYTK